MSRALEAALVTLCAALLVVLGVGLLIVVFKAFQDAYTTSTAVLCTALLVGCVVGLLRGS
jgi:flagellar biosynthesis protein FliQ